MSKIKDWFHESNRWLHFIAGFLAAFLTIGGTIAAAIAFECKDVQFANYDWKAWDWLDFLSTILGGILGTGVVIGLCFLVRSWIV